MSVRILSAGLSLGLLLIIVELIRRERLTFKYAFGWLTLCVVGILLIIFDKLLFNTARFFGFELASNFIFFSLLCGFIFISLILTIFLCQQNKRNDTMAQKIALLENEVEKIRQIRK
jgi:hypothetical protein